MTIAQNDVVQLTVHQSYGGSNLVNCFTYQNLNVLASTAEELAEAFWNYVKDDWMDAVSSDLKFSRVELTSYGEDQDVATFTIPVGETEGNRGSILSAPDFVAASVRLDRASRVTRPGFKRFCGVAEEDYEFPGSLTSGGIAVWSPFVALLDDQIDFGPLNADSIKPVIYSPPNSRHEGIIVQAVTAAVLMPRVTTQNSRKLGRGT